VREKDIVDLKDIAADYKSHINKKYITITPKEFEKLERKDMLLNFRKIFGTR